MLKLIYINKFETMNKKLLTTALIVAVVVALGAFAYSMKPAPTTSKQESKQVVKKEVSKVTIAMVTFPGYAPLYVAKEKGFFEGVSVDLKRIESMGDIRAAVRSKDVQVYAATHDMYQSTNDAAPIGVGFMAIDESHGADGVAVSADIKSVKDLKGKKVAAEPGFPPYVILQYLLNKEGMTLKDVDFKDMTTTDGGNAFATSKLDAAGIYEPALSASVKARKNSRVLVSSADLPGLIQDFLFADETFAKENPEALRAIADGYFKALDYINTNHDEAYEIMSRNFSVTKAEMEDFKTGVSWTTKAENIALFDKTNANSAYKNFSLIGDILAKNGEANIRVRADDKLTGDIINAVGK